jgi:FAD-linked sulfhydryl oxidase
LTVVLGENDYITSLHLIILDLYHQTFFCGTSIYHQSLSYTQYAAMAGPGASRRYIITLLTGSILAGWIFVSFFRGMPAWTPRSLDPALSHAQPDLQAPIAVTAEQLNGHSIMPKLGNETAKAELGRATWKYFHTVMARFPDKPTKDESSALKSYIHLFQRLYPCGECSEHFRQILDKFPPQTSSRSAAAVWACHVHNEVNKSLKKDIFDCANIGDFYDCGCAEDGGKAEDKETDGKTDIKEKDVGAKAAGTAMSPERIEEITGANGRDFNMDLLKEDYNPKLEREG